VNKSGRNLMHRRHVAHRRVRVRRHVLRAYATQILCAALEQKRFATVRTLLFNSPPGCDLRLDLSSAFAFVTCASLPAQLRANTLRHVLAHVDDMAPGGNAQATTDKLYVWQHSFTVVGFRGASFVNDVDTNSLLDRWEATAMGFARDVGYASVVETAWLATVMPMLVQGLRLAPPVVWQIATFCRPHILPPSIVRPAALNMTS
jgi:hypothetical protein